MKLRRAARRLASGDRSPTPEPAGEEPCIPCGTQTGIRAFSLNEIDIDAVADDVELRLAPDVEFAALDGEVVLFDPARSMGTLLNSTAALIWASIDDGTTVAALIDLLVAETQADRAVVDRDVRDTLARFIAGGILEPPPDPADRQVPPMPPAPRPAPAAAAATDRDQRRAVRIAAVLARTTWFGDLEPRRCSGASVLVRASTPELAAALAPALAALPTASGAATAVSVIARNRGARFEILVDTEVVARASSLPRAVTVALSTLDDLATGETRDRLVLHAGAVEREGRVTVVVGRSGAGKSTLTAHLVQQGHAYLSDEVAAIDPTTWTVTPYPKALALHDDALDRLGLADHRTDDTGKSRVLPGELGRVGTGGRVSLVVLLTGAVAEAGDPATPSTAATDLLDLLSSCFASTFDPATRPDRPLEALASLVATVPVLRLPRGTLDDAGRAIAAALAET